MNLISDIQKLKKERKAVILAHNYQLPEVQDVADFVGDSLGLSIQASRTEAEIIVFCGVHFMAETAKILSPGKKVLLPDPDSGCPMADMITAEQLRILKKEHPGAKVLCYVNTSAEVKAECDMCCTSANAEAIVRDHMKDEGEIIFVPDQYLATYVAEKTGREFYIWKGYCPTHARILPENIVRQREEHPRAEVLVHPECTPALTAIADQVLSTEGMCRYVAASPHDEFIVATEVGILHRMEKENPGKRFYPASKFAICLNMKRTTQEKILWSLQDLVHEIDVPAQTISRARRCIDGMLLSQPRR
ncbi:MAG: quinolinate synthase NadA [Smithellaceae bacterium]|nr:quinolinate synthase NadA [Smithellaceae bacterium]